jgi:hypothetical protein
MSAIHTAHGWSLPAPKILVTTQSRKRKAKRKSFDFLLGPLALKGTLRNNQASPAAFPRLKGFA